jgi:hypothetical protein
MSPGYSTLKSLDLLPWELIAEPYRPQFISLNSLQVNSKDIDLDQESLSILWLIDGEKYEGASAQFQVTSTGVKICSLTITTAASDSSSSYSLTHEFKLAVKYVRREIRSMTEEDRQAFFAALRTVSLEVRHPQLSALTSILVSLRSMQWNATVDVHH